MTKSPVSKKEGYAKNEDTVVSFRQPGSFSADPLTDVLRSVARRLLAQAVEAEVEAHIAAHSDLTDGQGRRRIVRHGYLPEREIQTGIGAVRVQTPRVRDRSGGIHFTSSILPRYLRRTKSVEELLPWLYLKGISTGDFGEALAALMGPDAPGLAASIIGRLKAVWWEEYEAWRRRDLSARRYVYFWADGVYFSPRLDMAETKADAEAAFDFFVQAYGAKYDKAVERLIKDRDRLLAFYNFPAEHWKHIRTTNPIESTCATVRLRTVKTKGCLNRKTALAMPFKLILSAKRKWRKLNGSDQLADIIDGVPFKDGTKQIERAA